MALKIKGCPVFWNYTHIAIPCRGLVTGINARLVAVHVNITWDKSEYLLLLPFFLFLSEPVVPTQRETPQILVGTLCHLSKDVPLRQDDESYHGPHFQVYCSCCRCPPDDSSARKRVCSTHISNGYHNLKVPR